MTTERERYEEEVAAKLLTVEGMTIYNTVYNIGDLLDKTNFDMDEEKAERLINNTDLDDQAAILFKILFKILMKHTAAVLAEYIVDKHFNITDGS